MEGYIAAIVVSGAALTVPRLRRPGLSTLLRAAVISLGALAALGVVWAIGLREWLTLTWALGLLASCIAVSTCAIESLATVRVLNAFSLVLALTAVVLSTAALLFPASGFLLASDVAHIPYRTDVQFVLFGDALLGVTAIGIAVGRLR